MTDTAKRVPVPVLLFLRIVLTFIEVGREGGDVRNSVQQAHRS